MALVRKAIPYGPLATSVGAASMLTPFSASSSAAGVHELTAQERSCGMLVSARDAVGGRDTTNPRPCAIVKAQTADFQSNEVSSDGAVAVLASRPRGRWRKLARNKTLLVEDDRTPFSDPQKSLQPRVQHHGEYVRRLGKLPAEMPVLRFVVYNDGYDHADVMHRFSYEIGVPPDAVRLDPRPPGGSFGCATQFGTGIGITREQIAHVSRHYNLHPLLFDPREYHPAEDFAHFASTVPESRVHRLVLRHTAGTEADVQATLRSLAATGFANYFGLEHFGGGGSTLFDMARFAARGDFLRATGCYLQMLADTDPLHHARYIAYINAEPDTTGGIATQWALQCRAARVRPEVTRAIDGLASFHSAAGTLTVEDVWRRVPVSAAVDDAAAKMVWNAMASQRLLLHRAGGAALPGDLVKRPDGSIVAVRTASEAARHTLTDVVLPVPVAGSLASCTDTLFPDIDGFNKNLYETFIAQHGFSALLEVGSDSSARPAVYRHVIEKPLHLQAAVVRDPNSLFALKTDLFLLQEHKRCGSFDLDYTQRAREPCVYNVSERFAEHMQALKTVPGSGDHSVAVSFVLRGGASPLVALREAFQLRYATIHDLYPL